MGSFLIVAKQPGQLNSKIQNISTEFSVFYTYLKDEL